MNIEPYDDVSHHDIHHFILILQYFGNSSSNSVILARKIGLMSHHSVHLSTFLPPIYSILNNFSIFFQIISNFLIGIRFIEKYDASNIIGIWATTKRYNWIDFDSHAQKNENDKKKFSKILYSIIFFIANLINQQL